MSACNVAKSCKCATRDPMAIEIGCYLYETTQAIVKVSGHEAPEALINDSCKKIDTIECGLRSDGPRWSRRNVAVARTLWLTHLFTPNGAAIPGEVEGADFDGCDVPCHLQEANLCGKVFVSIPNVSSLFTKLTVVNSMSGGEVLASHVAKPPISTWHISEMSGNCSD